MSSLKGVKLKIENTTEFRALIIALDLAMDAASNLGETELKKDFNDLRERTRKLIKLVEEQA